MAPTLVPYDVRCLEPEATVVDALARLQLAAMRSGFRIRLYDASKELLELIELMGLTEVFLGLEPGRQAE